MKPRILLVTDKYNVGYDDHTVTFYRHHRLSRRYKQVSKASHKRLESVLRYRLFTDMSAFLVGGTYPPSGIETYQIAYRDFAKVSGINANYRSRHLVIEKNEDNVFCFSTFSGNGDYLSEIQITSSQVKQLINSLQRMLEE